MIGAGRGSADYGARRLTVELTNTCNLHCSYCVRDDDALHHSPASFFSEELLARVLRDARDQMGIEHVGFTGGEPTLHRRLEDVLSAVADLSLTCSFVTNGWHFDRVWPLFSARRETVTHVAFSLDGVDRAAHDRWRGRGSFDRVVRAMSRCWASQFPFSVKVGIRRDTLPALERFALFAARMGAETLSFAHVMPTSPEIAESSGLTREERSAAEREIALLARIFKMKISIDVGYYNVDPAAPCSALAGVSANVDYRGRLSLCCNMSGFRNAEGQADIVGDLNTEPFAPAFARLRQAAADQAARRRAALMAEKNAGRTPDLATGSPCLYCLHTLGKMPWARPQ